MEKHKEIKAKLERCYKEFEHLTQKFYPPNVIFLASRMLNELGEEYNGDESKEIVEYTTDCE